MGKLDEANLDSEYEALLGREKDMLRAIEEIKRKKGLLSCGEEKKEAVAAIVEMARLKCSTNTRARNICRLSGQMKRLEEERRVKEEKVKRDETLRQQELVKAQEEERQKILVQQQEEQLLMQQ